MNEAPRILALLGSGETAPTMVKPHRALFERVGPGPAVVVDTPYGFQENADEISARAVAYFHDSVGRDVAVARLRRPTDDDPLDVARALRSIADARWVFAGPGSPTYSLRQWRPTEVPALLADKLAHGGAVVFASAAALTLGRRSVPVYEIYKSGDDPTWVEGLDLLAPHLGADVSVIPHYDNAEGGHHDTRFCYLGERRLRILEEQLTPNGWILGVDEHTGCLLDLDAGTASVVGNGTVTVRRRGANRVLRTGTVVAIDELCDPAFVDGSGRGSASPVASSRLPPSGLPAQPPNPASLSASVRAIEASFDAAVDAGDIDAAVRAVLELDATVRAWADDTTQSDGTDRAAAALRRMVVRLGDLARTGTTDPRTVVGPLVGALLAERAAARTERRYDAADRIRDALTDAGIEVRDAPEGTTWDLRAGPAGPQ